MRDPSKPFVPLSETVHHPGPLDPTIFSQMAKALDYSDGRVADRVRFGHRNMAEHNLDSVLSANWAGAYLHHIDISQQADTEQDTGWVDAPLEAPSTWPFVVDPQGGGVQCKNDDDTDKCRRTTDKWGERRHRQPAGLPGG